MKRIRRYVGMGVVLLLAAAIAAPHIRARRFAGDIQAALQRALGRQVRMSEVRFSLFPTPGFAVQKVVILEDPAIGIEPMAHVETLDARPRLWSLWTGKLEFASVRLEDASINLVKGDSGRWNFESLLNRKLIATFPSIHVSNGRINFKFGDTKSVFYLMIDELDIAPPGRGSPDWSVRFYGEPARSDRPARGFGSFVARGRWNGRRLDMGLELEKSAVGEMIALVRGQHAGIHGLVSSRMRVAGPLEDLQISGGLSLEDIHRWDLMPPKGEGWRLALQGRLNLLRQTLELEAHAASREALPFSMRFRVADYLSLPRWGFAANWNSFPAAPLLEVARHMGAQIPARLQLAGTLDGAIGYAGPGGLQGEVAFHNAAVTIPDSPAILFEEARVMFDRGHVHLAPALARTAQEDEARIEADYAFDTQALDLTISSDAMDVASLRSQVALAAVPWLEQLRSGTWKGQLRYQYGVETPGWSGRIELRDAEIPVPGLETPVGLESAQVEIQGERVALERIRAKVGKIRAQGEYRYEPRLTRPHRFRLAFAKLDASDLERVLMPTLRRSRGLLARALSFGRAPVPDWLDDRHTDGSVQIETLIVGDTHLSHVRARVIWDGTQAEIYNLQGQVENASLAGHIAVNLRGGRPAYRVVSNLKGIEWKTGKADAELVLETSGLGAELLARLRSELQLSTGGEVYTGRGATQPDGTLLVQLTSGTHEMRFTGTLAQLKVDESGLQ